MARTLIAALAAVTAALGILMENAWLLGLAVVFLLLAFVVLAYLTMRRRARRTRTEQLRNRTREDELRELGISEVRPRSAASTAPSGPSAKAEAKTAEQKPPATTTVAPATREADAVEDDEDLPALSVTPSPTEELAGGAAATPETGPLPEREPEPREDYRNVLDASDDHPIWQVHSPTAFASFLRACWAATEVQTAALAAAEPDGTYTLLAIRSHLPDVRKEGRFAADSFLHIAPPERPITVLEGNDPLARELPYYRGKSHVGSVAILPVEGPQRTVFLAVDIAPDQAALTDRQKQLLFSFASLLHTLLHNPPDDAQHRSVPTRRAIISEEMAGARTANRPLTLALVYRVDAEQVSAGGESTVAGAERDLRLLLEDLVHHGRLERFGELMYGAFLRDEQEFIEEWAARVQTRAEDEGFQVAVGAAAMRDQVDADAFRADAANALAEALSTEDLFAYTESGTA